MAWDALFDTVLVEHPIPMDSLAGGAIYQDAMKMLAQITGSCLNPQPALRPTSKVLMNAFHQTRL
jgi:hypothetical protein